MPFTLAHPAAIIPIRKMLGARASLSALIIGSMIPDVVYFVPLGVNGRVTHDWSAVIWFAIPAGLIAWLFFHLVVKRPFAALLPQRFACRLPAPAVGEIGFGRAALASVIVSLALGAFTHVAWDSFTHSHTDVVAEFDVLKTMIGPAGGIRLPLYKLLQYASSVFGLLALAWWTIAWAERTPAATSAAPTLPPAIRLAVLGAIATAGVAYGTFKAVSVTRAPVEYVVIRATVGCVVGSALVALVYCLGWHLHDAWQDRRITHRKNSPDARRARVKH